MGCKWCDQYPNHRAKDENGNWAVSPRRSKLRELILASCVCERQNHKSDNCSEKEAKTEDPHQKDH